MMLPCDITTCFHKSTIQLKYMTEAVVRLFNRTPLVAAFDMRCVDYSVLQSATRFPTLGKFFLKLLHTFSTSFKILGAVVEIECRWFKVCGC